MKEQQNKLNKLNKLNKEKKKNLCSTFTLKLSIISFRSNIHAKYNSRLSK